MAGNLDLLEVYEHLDDYEHVKKILNEELHRKSKSTDLLAEI